MSLDSVGSIATEGLLKLISCGCLQRVTCENEEHVLRMRKATEMMMKITDEMMNSR